LTLRVEFSDDAREQAGAASAWWRANRERAPDLFEDELSAAAEHLALSPLLTPVYATVGGGNVRRLLLPRMRYHLYFTIEGDVVVIHAVWHTARGRGPVL
jgi:plasmid stabilization system protein ParE